jgi:Putative MetA-pathway of phenol degradation
VSSTAKIILLAIWLDLLLAARMSAAAPFLTDDPEPTDYQHWEAYLFTSGDHTRTGYAINGPAAELDYGAFPDTQISLSIGMTTVSGDGMQTASGFGDAAFSVKYRFLHETNGWPELAVFPAVTLPTGDASRGLGNGRASFRLPLWAQKSFGSWTTYGGGGAVLNSAPGERDYPFGGWLLQRDFGKHLSLGGEIYAQGRDADADRGFVALNFGGSYNFTEHFSVQASAGPSIAGDDHVLWYFGLYWTW